MQKVCEKTRPIAVLPAHHRTSSPVAHAKTWSAARDACPEPPRFGSMTVPSRLATMVPVLELPQSTKDSVSLLSSKRKSGGDSVFLPFLESSDFRRQFQEADDDDATRISDDHLFSLESL